VALEEIGLDFTERLVDRGWLHSPDYLAVNPKGRLPTLIVDGRAHTETPAILTLLDRLYPNASLLPKGEPVLEADVLSTMCWFSSGIHPLIGRARFPGGANDDKATFHRTTEMAVSGLRANFAILEQRLDGSPWLFDHWSIVDAYLLWLWFRAEGIALESGEFPRCADHAYRCQMRPSVARALEREEASYAAMRSAGRLPPWEPTGQVGRVHPRPPAD
jgi:glutathione S-transferase